MPHKRTADIPSTTQNLLQSILAPQTSGLPSRAVIQVKSSTYLESKAFFQTLTCDGNKSEKNKRKSFTKYCSLR